MRVCSGLSPAPSPLSACVGDASLHAPRHGPKPSPSLVFTFSREGRD